MPWVKKRLFPPVALPHPFLQQLLVAACSLDCCSLFRQRKSNPLKKSGKRFFLNFYLSLADWATLHQKHGEESNQPSVNWHLPLKRMRKRHSRKEPFFCTNIQVRGFPSSQSALYIPTALRRDDGSQPVPESSLCGPVLLSIVRKGSILIGLPEPKCSTQDAQKRS